MLIHHSRLLLQVLQECRKLFKINHLRKCNQMFHNHNSYPFQQLFHNNCHNYLHKLVYHPIWIMQMQKLLQCIKAYKSASFILYIS